MSRELLDSRMDTILFEKNRRSHTTIFDFFASAHRFLVCLFHLYSDPPSHRGMRDAMASNLYQVMVDESKINSRVLRICGG